MTAPVVALRIQFVEQVSDDELERLLGRHPSAESFVAGGQKVQKAPELAGRIAGRVSNASHKVLRHIRESVGQWWIISFDDAEYPGSYLPHVRARWREPGGEWRPLRPLPQVSASSVVMGVADKYLNTADWDYVGRLLESDQSPSNALTLIAQANVRFHSGGGNTALYYLNSGVEWAVQEFIKARLKSAIPADALRAVLRQSYARLLEDWLLPLVREAGISLDAEWERIQDLRKHRNDALHPSDSAKHLSQKEFTAFLRPAVTVVGKLLDVREPRFLPHISASFVANGTPRSSSTSSA
jgi:hypothetical protein